jgi:hypothetical protein
MFLANCTNYCGEHNLRAVIITQPKMLEKTWCFEDTAVDIMTVVAVPNIRAGASVAGRYTVDTPGHITSFTPH